MKTTVVGGHFDQMEFKSKNPRVSVIIRSENEEDWIGHCLKAVFNQDYKNFEVIIVDHLSTDMTVSIAKQFSIKKTIYLKNYVPGLSLNRGIRESEGEIIVILSAHCIPINDNWLKNLVKNFEIKKVVGVYGRQIPLSFSTPFDIRDLFITFGLDKRIQIKDYFFHNANSAILRWVWEEFPFDEHAISIEDRIWAKQVTEAGYRLFYEPDAVVYHHHGIHQNQNIHRVTKTIEVLKEVEHFDDAEIFPDSLKPENRNIVAFVPIKTALKKIKHVDPIENLVSELRSVNEIGNVFLVSRKKTVSCSLLDEKVKLIERPQQLNEEQVSLGDVLKWSLEEINRKGSFPEYIIYANPEYIFRPNDLIQNLILDICYKGLDSVFVGYVEFQNYWSFDQNREEYIPIGENLLPRSKKHPLYKSLFGLGCITRSRIVREGRLIGKKRVGVIETSDVKHTLRVSDPAMLAVIEGLIN